MRVRHPLRILLGFGAAAICGLLPASPPAEPDWSAVDAVQVDAFYPGIASIEWVLGDVRIGRARHSGGSAVRQGHSCLDCHADEARRMGALIASGTAFEPGQVDGRPGSIPVQVQAAHDGETFYLHLSWTHAPEPDAAVGGTADAVGISFMLEAGTLGLAGVSGCWATCHDDSRGMRHASPWRDTHVDGGDPVGSGFRELLQWRSGSNRGHAGLIAAAHVPRLATDLVAEGARTGDTWAVTFTRPLAGAPGRIALTPGRSYPFGLALHSGSASGRRHFVSLDYRLGIDAAGHIIARRF